MNYLKALGVMVVLVLSQLIYPRSADQSMTCVTASITGSNLPPVLEVFSELSSKVTLLQASSNSDAFNEDWLILSVEEDFKRNGLFEVSRSLSDVYSLYYYDSHYYDPESGRVTARYPSPEHESSIQILDRSLHVNSRKGVDMYTLTGEELNAFLHQLRYILHTVQILSYTRYHFSVWNYLNSLISQRNYLLVIVDVLILLGYDSFITCIAFRPYGTGSIYLDIDKTEGEFYQGGEHVDWGITKFPEEEGKRILITIYLNAFFNEKKSCSQKLWHVVGHEVQHVLHAVSGTFWEWVEKWGWNIAVIRSEYLAWLWNDQYWILVPLEDSEFEYLISERVEYYYHLFFGTLGTIDHKQK